jgi:hypothetical protein
MNTSRAYLWYGTKPIHTWPVEVTEKVLTGQLPLDVKLVSIPMVRDDNPILKDDRGFWALAIAESYHYYDWNMESKRFEMMNPWPDQYEGFVASCKALGWPCPIHEIGWYQGATYW